MKFRKFSIYFLMAFVIATVSVSCNRKSGCPVNDEAHVKPDKKGKYSKKKGSSNLFPKHMRRG